MYYTRGVNRVFRTPDERFASLPDFPYDPVYRDVDGLRLAHVDVGDGPPVLLLHGSPAWSFIWRKTIPALREAGFRCIAPDHAGYGRSDKPLDPDWYSVERHVELAESLLDELDLRDVTLVVHDWGGPIGLTLALRRRDRIARMAVLDTAIDPRETWMNETWVRFREFVLATEDLPVGEVMRGTCAHGLDADALAAYEAPFPTPESTVVLGAMMGTVPRPGEDAAAMAERFYDALRRDPRPMLIVWAESDLYLTLASGQRLAARIGREIDHVVAGAGHALPEDEGPLLGRLIADWLRTEPAGD
jgi:haloalkane dehalogenase